MDKEHLLNQYFENSLTEEEKLMVEQLLASDSEFLEEFNLRKNLKIAFSRNEREELKAKLKQHETEKKRIQFNWKYVAAAILVFGMGAFFLIQNLQEPKDLYTTYYQTYPNTVSPIVRGDSSEKSLSEQAFQAYEEKNFQLASTLFLNLYKENQEEYALFYQAMSFMEIEEKTTEAISILSNTQWSEQYEEKAKWYLAMAYLMEKKHEQAKEVLKSMTQKGNYRKEQVKELLEKL